MTGIKELLMDIWDLINLRKEECSLKRAKMTGFIKGQRQSDRTVDTGVLQ